MNTTIISVVSFSIALLVGITCFLVIIRSFVSHQRLSFNPISFLLAKGSLYRRSIVSLLLSSSFGVNALLYAAWLGYSVGAWGLAVQAAWGLSYLLLSPYSARIHSVNSLHELLGNRFDRATKLLAAICTLIGFVYLMGWELEIGSSSIYSILSFDNHVAEEAKSTTNTLMVGVVLGTVFYTLWGGMRGNAIVDQLLNLIKVIIITLFTLLLINRFIHIDGSNFLTSMFPSVDTMKKNLGLFGLITNILFNLAWQFVDNSSWQSVIAGAENLQTKSTKNLQISGFVIFLTIGLLGTLFGISLANTANITPDNILTQAVVLLPQHQTFMTVAMVIMIAACMMSLLDVLFLSSTFTLTMDIMPSHPKTTAASTDINNQKILRRVRVSLLVIALTATWGVNFIFQITGSNLFDFVYIVIITQLALFGPVIIALTTDRIATNPMWICIAIALTVGFGAIAAGTIFQNKLLLDGAGTLTLFTSMILALLNIVDPKKQTVV